MLSESSADIRQHFLFIYPQNAKYRKKKKIDCGFVQENLPVIAFQLKLFQELCMISQMFADERSNEEVRVIISFSKFVQKWQLSFCGCCSEIVGQQLVLFQKLIFVTLIDENF
jgi:hypothetical protein